MLQEIWFFVLGVFLIVYAILDGFDLGGAFISPFLTKDDRERRVILNAIGRVWDGNEVWLVAFGAFLFGMFPVAFAKFFSAAYIPVMLLAAVVILRAFSFEARSQYESIIWRKTWDWVLSISSLLIMAVLAAAAANVMKGTDIGKEEPFRLHLFEALNPFAIVTAVSVVSIFTLHGLLYIANKTEGELYERALSFSKGAWVVAVLAAAVWLAFSAIFERQVLSNFLKYPIFAVAPILAFASILLTRAYIANKNERRAFMFSSVGVGSVVASFGFSLYPVLIRSYVGEEYNITIYNASSEQNTLLIGLVVALIGFILAPIYQIYVYKTFAGRVKQEDIHY